MKNFAIFSLVCIAVASVVAQPSHNMNLRGQWSDDTLPINSVRYNDLWGYTSGGRNYALIGSLEFIHFIDVTTPSAANEIARIGGGSSTIWRDVKTYGSYAYAVADDSSEGLLVFDLSNLPATVTLAAQITDVFTSAHNIFIDGGFAFIVGAQRGVGKDLIIYDLRTTPGNPTHWGSFTLPNGYAHDVFVDGTIAYGSHELRGLSVYDLQNTLFPSSGSPVAPIELGRIDTYFNPGYNHSSWSDGSIMVMADETHGAPLSIVDVTDFDDMQELSYFQSNLLGVSNPYSGSGPIPHNPFLIGNFCYVSHYHDGVVVFDISDPLGVEIAAYYDTNLSNTNYSGFQGAWGIYPFLGSDMILVSDVDNGLFVLEQTNTLPNIPLPVAWGPFEAQSNTTYIQLDWSTYEEINNKGFHIERQDRDGKFERIGWVAAELDQKYEFADLQARIGRNYYRLAQEDWDGTTSYSRIVSATIGRDKEVVISPNPAQAGQLVELIGHTATLRFPLTLYRADGMYVRQYIPQEQQGTSLLIQIPANLSSGTYYLADGEDWQQQIVIK